MNKNSITKTQDILIVDDTLANLKVLSETLTSEGYEVRAVKNGKTALMAVQTMPPSLILLDINMPEINGYEVCQQLKTNEATCNIPIIFLTASNEAHDKIQAFESGGVDYIAKPFQIEEVLARVKNQLEMQAAQAEIRQLNIALEEKVQERTKHLNQKINELEQTKKVLHDTFYDRLTDLPNHLLFSKHLDKAVTYTRKEQNYGFAILFIKCDWQDISQLVEHKLILAIVKIISSSIREVDTLARVSSDKFAVLLPEMNNIYRATYIAQQIHQQVASPLTITQQKIEVDLSIGIVLGTKEYQQAAHILRDAKRATYQAQKLGKNCCYLFSGNQQKVNQS